MRRSAIARAIVQAVGADVLKIDRMQGAWPAEGTVLLDDGPLPVALFVGSVGLSHRNRDDIERRFQNPSNRHPIVLSEGRLPLLLGLWSDDPKESVQQPVLVAADAVARAGRETRFSVFARLQTLKNAIERGWAEDESAIGESIYCFHPALLPAYVAMLRSATFLPGPALAVIADASGLGLHPADSPAERARRVSSTLIRKARFGRDVVDAYDGLCAMCGLNLGLVQGAHIYPASAPASSDEPWNGIALCNNHHAAFDKHLLWVHPETREVRVHPDLRAGQTRSAASRRFVESTQPVLSEPTVAAIRPRADMFRRRYDYFGSDRYSWIG